jgi:hypothetical protein
MCTHQAQVANGLLILTFLYILFSNYKTFLKTKNYKLLAF